MPEIDWDALIADIVASLMACFSKKTPSIEEARPVMREPEILPVFRLARKARRRARAPRRDTPKYMKAVRERCAALTDEECDELYAEATESDQAGE